MTLGFKQAFEDGTPTEFVQKIWASVPDNWFNYDQETVDKYTECIKRGLIVPDTEVQPKLHTIREGAEGWATGTLVHAVIGNRTKHRFQFMPTFPAAEVLPIIINPGNAQVRVGECNFNANQVDVLALNDGFADTAAFWRYFNRFLVGKLIVFHPQNLYKGC
jgi:hypothetical protein